LDGLREPPRLTALVLRDYLRAGLGRSVSTLRAMNAHPMPARLQSLSIPSLLVVGDRDPVVPRAWAREVIERLPRGRIVVIDDGTHGIQYAEPDALAGAIRDDIQAERLS
ncbi:MAG: alpha/beta hydrolase, partial [Thermomicrobiales bacterium]|nr:alpha/beta hydrolase [Thermomicrobiales bacterium]